MRHECGECNQVKECDVVSQDSCQIGILHEVDREESGYFPSLLMGVDEHQGEDLVLENIR